jgi:hypothetical protein
MAELHVEPRKKSATPSWVWILVGLVIIAVVIYFVTRNNNNNSNTTTANPNGTTSYVQMDHQYLAA